MPGTCNHALEGFDHAMDPGKCVGNCGRRSDCLSICANDYTPFFHDAVSVIDTACDVFEPPG